MSEPASTTSQNALPKMLSQTWRETLALKEFLDTWRPTSPSWCQAGLVRHRFFSDGKEKEESMAYVVTAIWTAKEGQEERILGIIQKMTPLSRQEPGCLYYQAQRSLTDPRVFFLYEQYVDAAGYEAHMATPHFEHYVKGVAIPNLESRERTFSETIDG